MGLPKVGKSQIEKEGVGIVTAMAARERRRGGLGFIYRNQPEADAGIDGHIEIIDSARGEYTGKLVGVQVKTGPSFFRRRTADGWTVYIERSTVEYWRRYVVPVILTVVDVRRGVIYWALGSEAQFPSTKKYYKILVPASQRLDSSSSDAITALARQAPADLLKRLRTLAAEVTATTASDLERHRNAWREGRRADARAWLAARTSAPEQLASIEGQVAAAVLRFAASTTLDEGGDIEAARAWVEEARRRDPTSDDARLRAALLVRDSDPAAALEVLVVSRNSGAQIMRASILCETGDSASAAAVLDALTPETNVDVADVWRLRARLSVIAGDWKGALDAVAAAEAVGPQYAQVRLLRAVLIYHKGIVLDARPRDLPRWPTLIPQGLVRASTDAVSAFESAAEAFRQLLDLDWTAAERRNLEAWHLASLCAVPARRTAAEAFARGVLARDAAQPFVLYWAIGEGLKIDPEPSLDALAAELDRTGDVSVALIYLGALFGANHGEGAGAWLDSWRDRFTEGDASEQWMFWRARAHLELGEIDLARALLAGLPDEGARVLEMEILAAEARRTGDNTELVAFLEQTARESGDTQFLLAACREHARAGQWDAVAPHVDELLTRLPTAFVRRLVSLALYKTHDFARCAALLDQTLALPDADSDLLELRRMRGDVRLRLGDLRGAVEDLKIAAELSGSPPATSDLMALARAYFFAGQSHELAMCAREAATRADLGADDALTLAEVLAHDDRLLAVDLWKLANAGGISDARVPNAVTLGFQLGLDAQVEPLHTRMLELAMAGAPNVTAVSLDELLEQQRSWIAQRQRVLDLYERGETPTHLVAQFLNLPLVHFYHVLPNAIESQAALRHQFALRFRDGGRSAPGATTFAAPGRLALDLSALLLAEHLGILADVEAQFAPLRLSSLVLVALREQRDKLKPHQPSRLEVRRRLLRAERDGKIRMWDGELPALDAETRTDAAQWSHWVALLERARREEAFVLDLPLQDETPHGRPVAVAGAERLERMLTLKDLRKFLVTSGALDPLDSTTTVDEFVEVPNGNDIKRAETLESSDSAQTNADSVECRPLLAPGSVLYLTDAGAEALADSGLLDAAAGVFVLRVDPADQSARRAELEAVPELEDRAAWVEGLMRRVSEGLLRGRYVMLPPGQGIDEDEADEELQVDTPAGAPQNSAPAAPEVDVSRGTETEGSASRFTEATDVPPGRAIPVDSAPATRRESSMGTGSQSTSLSFRLLADLVSQPPGTVDAVWIDDRWINRHQFASAARLVDVLDVVAALAATGRITAQRRWAIHNQLRRANVRVLPLIADEILHHLRAAHITDGAVVETPPLRVLRQYSAALIEDVHALRVPTFEQLATGQTGELECLRAYNTAVRDTLIELWRSARNQPGVAGRAEAEARSRWLMSNLYVDLGLLRAHVIQVHQARQTDASVQAQMVPPASAPEPSLSALDAAALLTNAAQLISAGEKLRGPADDLGAAYAQWVYDAVVVDRAARDAGFHAALLARLRDFFVTWPSTNDKHRQRRAFARLFAGWTFDALPEPLRDALAEDRTLLRSLGRSVTTSLTVGPWNIALRTFAEGAVALLAGGPASNGIVEIPALGSDPPVTLTLTRVEPDSFVLSSPDGSGTMQIRDVAFGILSPSNEKRAAACEAVRREADLGVDAWRRVTQRLVSMEDPVARFEALANYRQRALRTRYAAIAQRWREERRVHVDDLRSAPPDVVLDHLRLDPESLDALIDLTTKRGGAPDAPRADFEGGQFLGTTFRDAWDRAADVLIAEEGIVEAFKRLACLPVPMPSALRRSLEVQPPEKQRAFVRGLLSSPTSPIGAAHILRILAWLGETKLVYRRLAWRLARRAASPEVAVQIQLQQLVAMEALDALRFRSPTTTSAEPGGKLPRRTKKNSSRVATSASAESAMLSGTNSRTTEARASSSPTTARTDLMETPQAPAGVESPRPESRPVERMTSAEGSESHEMNVARPTSEVDGAAESDPVEIISSWHHAHRFFSALIDTDGPPAGLLDWLKGRATRDTSTLFAPGGLEPRDVANPRLLRAARFTLGALQYVGMSTSFFEKSDRLLEALTPALSSGAQNHRVPHFDLLRDLDANPDVLGTWLRPVREDDDSIVLGAHVVIPSHLAPSVLRDSALDQLAQDPFDSEPWIMLDLVQGIEPLTGNDAERFERATTGVDVQSLLQSLGKDAVRAARRLSRQAWGVGRTARRDWLRNSLVTVANTPTSPARDEGAVPNADGLTEWQGATVEALYVLARAEPTPEAAMRAFARDLATLSRRDAAYLRRIRGTLERLVEGSPLAAALACLPLLAEARGT